MYFYDPVSCNQIDINYVDKKVYVTGMIVSIKKCFDIILIGIQDKSGTIQASINPKIINNELYVSASSLEEKKYITICGIIEYRDLNNVNLKMKTGRLELIADDFFLINPQSEPQFDLFESSMIFTEEINSNSVINKYL